MKLLSEAGKKFAKRNVERLKTLKATIEAMIAETEDGVEGETKESATVVVAEAALRLADTLDALRQRVAAAIRTKLNAEAQSATGMDVYLYPWVRDLFADTCVFEVGGRLYRAPYTVDGESVTIGAAVEVELSYTDKGVTEVTEAGQALDLEFVPLVEKAVRKDGTVAVKLIDPGWGSTGYYSKEVLERDGPKAFRKGLKMFSNHMTPTEEAERPEGRIEDLVAVLASDARWEDNGADGPGLYADAKVIESWRADIDALAADIGVSIRAMGKPVYGEAEGRKGPIIEAIAYAKSVDFVTDAGRGGKILSLREAAKQRHTGGTASAGSAASMEESNTMGMTDAERQQLQTLNESNTALQGMLKTLLEGNLKRDAKDLARGVLAGINLPDASRARLAESVQPIIKDGALDVEATTAAVRESAKAEGAYLAQLGGAGAIVGMGESLQESAADEVKPEVAVSRMAEGFAELGLSESAAKAAAQGRN
jgi:hypothetical protein